MKDQWTEVLRCPECPNEGIVSLSYPERAKTPTVDSIQSGFLVVHTKYGPRFHCEACNIPVMP